MTTIHDSAFVHPQAQLAEDVEVGPGCYVGPNVKMGSGCVLLPGAIVDGYTEIGSGNRFFPHAVVGTDPQDLKFQGEETTLVIGNDNAFREHVTVNRGTRKGGGITRIGDRNLFMACSHVAHDCIIGNGNVLSNNVLLGGHITIQDDAVLSGAAAFHHFTTVGRMAFVGGLTRIVRDVPPYMIVEGNPARIRGVNAVKLERLGLEDGVLKGLREAYRVLWKSGNNFNESLSDLDGRDDLCDEVRYLVNFLRKTDDGEHGRALESTRRVE